jgi:hypothetical protein
LQVSSFIGEAMSSNVARGFVQRFNDPTISKSSPTLHIRIYLPRKIWTFAKKKIIPDNILEAQKIL